MTAAKLTGDPERDVKALSNHVFQLEEQLRYQLRNLDVTNFNDLGLMRYENGRLQIYTKVVEAQVEQIKLDFGKETDEIYAQISLTAEELLAEIEDVEGNYTSLKATVNGIQTTVSGHTSSIGSLQSQITQTNSKISAVVSAVDDSSGNVTAASIVAAINSAGSTVKISADHIQLSGVVTVEDLAGNGTVEINAGNIAAGGTISGVALQTKTGSWTNIEIDGDSITFGDAAFIGLDSTGGLGIFSNHGPLELSGNGHVRIYDNDKFPGYYWQFYAWGLALHDTYTDEPVRSITAENY